jgi:hypothetical protein
MQINRFVSLFFILLTALVGNLSYASKNSGTNYTNASIETDGQVTLTTDKDVKIKGGNIDAGSIHYDVKGNVIVQSVQNTSKSKNKGFGITVSQRGIENLSINHIDLLRE